MRDRVKTPSAREYRACLDVAGTVQELLGAGKPGEAREQALAGMQRLLHGAAVFWTVLDGDQKTSSDPSRSAILGLEDWQRRVWAQPFFDEGDYVEHPIWDSLNAGRGTLRSARRADVVAPRMWDAHPHHQRARALGMNDEVVSMAPLGDGRECLVGVSRREGDRLFQERDRHLLHALHGALRSSYREIAESATDAAGRPRVAGLTARLAPRFHPVLAQLLTGRSEKEIAVALGLSPRTIHKYVEIVFRAARVSSRAELMALFIPPGATDSK